MANALRKTQGYTKCFCTSYSLGTVMRYNGLLIRSRFYARGETNQYNAGRFYNGIASVSRRPLYKITPKNIGATQRRFYD